MTLILLRDPWTSILITITLCMIEIDLIGVMALWNINLNALSVVNMVMYLGISVEFSVHIAYAFFHGKGSKEERAKKALVDMGSSIFSGTLSQDIYVHNRWIILTI